MGKYLPLAALLLATNSANAAELKALDAASFNVGAYRGVVFFTDKQDGYRVVATIANGETGLPVPFEATLYRTQNLSISVPGKLGEQSHIVEISRAGAGFVIEPTPVLVKGKDTTNLNEYDYDFRGREFYMQFQEDKNERAGDIWREGLRRFPNSPLLHVDLGWYYWDRAFDGWSTSPTADFQQAEDLAKEALAYQKDTPLVRQLGHALLAHVDAERRDFNRALKETELALAVSRYEVYTKADIAQLLNMANFPEKALDWSNQAIAADPANAAWYLYSKGQALTLLRKPEEAIESLKRAEDWINTAGYLAINYVRLNKLDEAKAELKKLLARDPGFSVKIWREITPYHDPEILNREVSDLAKAGLPEK